MSRRDMSAARASMPDRDRFGELVVEALDALPEWVHGALDNVEVLVDDDPPEGVDPDTLGLYEGIPLTERGSDYTGVLPDRVTEAGHDEGALKRVIGETVVHEIAHHFGIDDERLHEIDRY
jgi:predicted Zn-dependent protease with MMP-like domain